ncbi:ABC transporter substrate-binding protein [Caviibacter abscessus]|uniref:ABC transporter substrate-binding protein n=1 Tax=Caviibacter abscessus TaxID=1766719 RepID=UPI00083589A7|nr:ABC transporter substrate-binding protein [Caviibacter abscessus]
MKKHLTLFLLFITMLSCSLKKEKKETKISTNYTYSIGISEITSHPSLDLVIKGISETLKNDNVDIQVMVANGELATANLIASNFNKNKDIVIGVGTGAAQALKNNITDKPILFSAVSDPKEAGLMAENITGVSDMILDVNKSLKLLKEKFPNTKTIGILFSSSELNSAVQVKNIKKAAKDLNLKVIEGAASNANDLVQVTNVLIEKVDAIYVPTDNLVVSNISYVIDIANKKSKPLIVSENVSVQLGALFAYGVDYYEIGKRTAELVKEILNGKDISQIPYEAIIKTKLYFNKDTAKKLNVTFDDTKKE